MCLTVHGLRESQEMVPQTAVTDIRVPESLVKHSIFV